MKDKDFSRREFLLKASALGAISLGGSSLLAACGGKQGATESPSTETPSAAPNGAQASAGGCNDLSGLTEQEKQMRTALQYVDATTMPEKRCDNCQLYITPEMGAACGGCKILKGPIAPAGHCTSWAAKQA